MKKVKIGPRAIRRARWACWRWRRQLERVEGYIQAGRDQGARVVTGGARPSHLSKGYFIEPTLFTHVDPKARIAQEEIFGPVLSLFPAKDEEEAIALANDTIYGLNASVLTNDANRASRWRAASAPAISARTA